jgi:hypothetical protein
MNTPIQVPRLPPTKSALKEEAELEREARLVLEKKRKIRLTKAKLESAGLTKKAIGKYRKSLRPSPFGFISAGAPSLGKRR